MMSEADPTFKSGPRSWSRGCLGLFFAAALLFLILVFIPAARRGRSPAERTQCKNNLKQIGLALHNYHDVFGSLPPAYTVDSTGKRLHSWRTLILPFLESSDVYDSIDLAKPWNHPVNEPARNRRPQVYACPTAEVDDDQTSYMAVVGEDRCFVGSTSRSFNQMTVVGSDASDTIAVVEIPRSRSLHWMEPEDTASSFLRSLHDGTITSHTGGFQVLMLDGSVRFVGNSIDRSTLDSLTFLSVPFTGAEY